MRRIIKHANVTTSDDFFLLADVLSEKASLLDEPFDSDAEPTDEISVDANQASDKSDSPEKGAHVSRAHAQEIAQLNALRDQIIAQATSEAARVIQEAHAHAQAEYQSAVNRAAKDIESARQEAMLQGRKEALEAHSAAITDCISALENSISRMEGAQAGFIDGYEKDLKWLALEIAQKVLMDSVADDETRLIPLVMTAINSVKTAPWISVEVSEKMTRLLTQLQKELQALPFSSNISLKLVSGAQDTCLVETPDRCIDASISKQIENLKGYFTAEQG